MYARKTNKFGNEMADKDGLPLYQHSLWGSNNIESGHQTLSQGFGNNRAGVEYTDCLLAVIRQFASWRASKRNWPGFPQVRHYDGLKIDTINVLDETIFGYPKYRGWMHFNEIFVLLEAAGLSISLYGVIPLEQDLITISREEIMSVIMGMKKVVGVSCRETAY